jgi:hypothetical protein
MEILSLVKQGAVDVGVLFAINHPAEIPLHGILSMGGWRTKDMASRGVATLEWESERTAPLKQKAKNKIIVKPIF